jgi:hypothetical protein
MALVVVQIMKAAAAQSAEKDLTIRDSVLSELNHNQSRPERRPDLSHDSRVKPAFLRLRAPAECEKPRRASRKPNAGALV